MRSESAITFPTKQPQWIFRERVSSTPYAKTRISYSRWSITPGEDEGSKTTRRLANSIIIFLYTGMNLGTSGTKTTMRTEALPLDMLIFDEVQGMARAQVEKTKEVSRSESCFDDRLPKLRFAFVPRPIPFRARPLPR